MKSRPRSTALFAEARRHIAGGVNSAVRAFRAVGGDPVFFERGEGAYLWDVDGNRYIDYVGSWGPAILGHAHPEVVAAVKKAADTGLSFGAPTEIETRMAALIKAAMPSIEKIRMVSSGTEATLSAIRLARVHRARQDHQVRGLLSRIRRFALGKSRVKRTDPRCSQFAGGTKGFGGTDGNTRIQQRRASP